MLGTLQYVGACAWLYRSDIICTVCFCCCCVSVPYVGNEHWTSGLGIPVKEGWRQWTIDGQVGGYVTEYDSNGFTFITVKGSGHMVPQV